MRQVRRILYVRTDRVGDALMNLPALRVLRQNYPKAWMTLMTDKSVSGLFKGHPDLDEVLEVDAGELAQNAALRGALVRKTRDIHYDLAVISNPSKFFHWLAFAGGIPLRVGWRRKWPFFLNRTLPDHKDKARAHEMDSNLSLAALVCEKRWDGLLRLGREEAASKKMKQVLEDYCGPQGVIAVHTGTSHSLKRWPAENYAQLCRGIQVRRKYRVVFVGGPEETGPVEGILRRLDDAALDLTGKTSWQELAALLADERVKTLVSSDSGPVHIAWILGKPVVALYARGVPGSDPVRWGPRGGRSRVIFKPMNEIKTDEVLQKLEEVLAT